MDSAIYLDIIKDRLYCDSDDGRNVLLNQMSKPYADYALSDTEMAVWETALRVRSDVNGVLETARADKRIGKSLERTWR